jgi:hypothetical protein
VRYVAGHVLDDDEAGLAVLALGLAIDRLEYLNGTAPDALLQLRAELAASAASAARKQSAQVSASAEVSMDAAAVILAASAPMTAAQAAAELGITARAVRYRCQDGTLPGRLDAAGRWLIDAGPVAAEAARRKGAA